MGPKIWINSSLIMHVVNLRSPIRTLFVIKSVNERSTIIKMYQFSQAQWMLHIYNGPLRQWQKDAEFEACLGYTVNSSLSHCGLQIVSDPTSQNKTRLEGGLSGEESSLLL